MDFDVALLLIGAGEFSSADITDEGFLSGVGSNVGGQVVAATEGPHADATLEGLLTCKSKIKLTIS